MGKLFLLLFSIVAVAPPPNDAPIRSDAHVATSPANDIKSLSTTNTECATARSIADEGVFFFDNRGPVTVDDPRFRDCLNEFDSEVLNDVWYCWTSPCDGDVTVDTCGGTTVDTMLAVYSGCGCITGPKLACNGDGCGFQSRTTFQAAVGEQYLIRLGTAPFDFAEGGTGTFTVLCESAPTLLCEEPVANCQSRSFKDASASDGTSQAVAENFTPSTDGDVSSICWWGTYFDGGSDCRIGSADEFDVTYYADDGGLPGALIAGPFRQADGSLIVSGPGRPTYTRLAETDSVRISPEQSIDGLTSYSYSGTHEAVPVLANSCYWIEITNRLGSDCIWYWQESAGGDAYSSLDGYEGGVVDGHDSLDTTSKDLALCLNVPLAARASCTTPPENDACEAAISITGGETLFTTRGASTDGLAEPYFCYGDEICCDLPLGDRQIHSDVWFDYEATCTGLVILDVRDADFDSKIGVYTGDACPDTFGMMACSDDAGPGLEYGSQVSFQANEFDRFKIRVGQARVDSTADCFVEHDNPGCGGPACEAQVCASSSSCCSSNWSSYCVDLATELCRTQAAGRGMLEVFCLADAPDTSCNATPVQSLPAVLDTSATRHKFRYR